MATLTTTFDPGQRVWLRVGAGHTEADAGVVAEVRFVGFALARYLVVWPTQAEGAIACHGHHYEHELTA